MRRRGVVVVDCDCDCVKNVKLAKSDCCAGCDEVIAAAPRSSFRSVIAPDTGKASEAGRVASVKPHLETLRARLTIRFFCKHSFIRC